MSDNDSVEELIKALDDESLDGEIFEFVKASYKLWKLGDVVVDALEPLIYESSDKVCIRAAYVLGNIGTEHAYVTLTKALEDHTSALRKNATQWEIWRDDQAAKEFYLNLYSRPMDWPFEEAVDDVTVRTLIEAMKQSELPRDEVYALAKVGDARVIESLIWALRIEDDKIFHDAFFGLLNIGKAAVKPLIARLHDENPQLRVIAARLLGAIGDEQAVGPLIKMLNDVDTRDRIAVIEALGDLCNMKASAPIGRFLNDEDEWTRRAVIISLGQIGEKNLIDMIVSALGDSSRIVQLGAAQVLAEWGDNRARDKLTELLATDWREEAQNALRRLDGQPDAPSIFDKEYNEQ